MLKKPDLNLKDKLNINNKTNLKDKFDMKNFKSHSQTKTGKIIIFVLVIAALSLGAFLIKQANKKPAEEPEVFVPLDSTKEEFLEKEKEIIVEPKDEVIEIKEDLSGEFNLKSEFEQDIIDENRFSEFEGDEEMDAFNEENMPKDKFERAEMELEGLIKEFNEENGFSDKSDEEIWRKANDAFDELDSETNNMN